MYLSAMLLRCGDHHSCTSLLASCTSLLLASGVETITVTSERIDGVVKEDVLLLKADVEGCVSYTNRTHPAS